MSKSRDISDIATGVTVVGTVTATDFSGDGSALTGLPAGYADSDVNTHLNSSSATSGQVLSWDGTDYSWIAAGSAASTSYGAVGTYAVFVCLDDNISIGATRSGSRLRRKSSENGNGFVGFNGTSSTSTPSGTWRLMSIRRTNVTSGQSGTDYTAHLWVRIS